MVSYDFGLILIFFITLFLLFVYPTYALINGKIISGGKERQSGEKSSYLLGFNRFDIWDWYYCFSFFIFYFIFMRGLTPFRCIYFV